MFFRASFRQGLSILKTIAGFREDYWFTWGNNLQAMGLTLATRNILIVALLILLVVDVCKYRGKYNRVGMQTGDMAALARIFFRNFWDYHFRRIRSQV